MKDILDKFIEEDERVAFDKENKLILKRVFSDDYGQYALGIILDRCKFMTPCENEGDMALNNFAKELVIDVFSVEDEDEKSKFNFNSAINFIKTMLRGKKK